MPTITGISFSNESLKLNWIELDICSSMNEFKKPEFILFHKSFYFNFFI